MRGKPILVRPAGYRAATPIMEWADEHRTRIGTVWWGLSRGLQRI